MNQNPGPVQSSKALSPMASDKLDRLRKRQAEILDVAEPLLADARLYGAPASQALSLLSRAVYALDIEICALEAEEDALAEAPTDEIGLPALSAHPLIGKAVAYVLPDGMAGSGWTIAVGTVQSVRRRATGDEATIESPLEGGSRVAIVPMGRVFPTVSQARMQFPQAGGEA